MAQKQYTTYQADITSFELRDALMGILKPGRYSGYDTMAPNGSQVGNDIPIRLYHNTGQSKYDKTNPIPVLEAQRGVAITNQGAIITEDSPIDVTITAHGADGYHVIYMRHAYLDGVSGANNAIYGVVSQSGSTRPNLNNPSSDVIIGVVREINGGGAPNFGELTYYPFKPGYGDQDLFNKLFKANTQDTYEVGTVPSDGIIGNRSYTNNNYITDNESITDSLDELDGALADVDNRPLDSADWPALSDNTINNATASAHGLLPKLSNIRGEFLQGNGNWTTIDLKGIRMRTNPPSSDFSINTAGASSQDFDLSSIVLTDTFMVLLEISALQDSVATTNCKFSIHDYNKTSAGGATFISKREQTSPNVAQIWCDLSSVGNTISVTLISGNFSDLSSLSIRVMGYAYNYTS